MAWFFGHALARQQVLARINFVFFFHNTQRKVIRKKKTDKNI